MSLTLLMSSSTSPSLKSVSHESLGGVVPDTEDTCCSFLIWLTPRCTSTAGTLPCTTLEREIFFAAHVWQHAEGGHGPPKVASQHVRGNEENDSLIMNWWWLCLTQNSFLYWGSTRTEVCCVQQNDKILTCCCVFVHTSQAGHSHPVLNSSASWKHTYNIIWQILQVNNLSYILSNMLIICICCFLKFLWLLYTILNEYLYPQVIQLWMSVRKRF